MSTRSASYNRCRGHGRAMATRLQSELCITKTAQISEWMTSVHNRSIVFECVAFNILVITLLFKYDVYAEKFTRSCIVTVCLLIYIQNYIQLKHLPSWSAFSKEDCFYAFTIKLWRSSSSIHVVLQ